jgi:hypothetical protein
MIAPFFATPMYGGLCHASYLLGMKGVWEACASAGIPNMLYAPHDSLVARARNDCVAEFLRRRNAGEPFTHLFFVDADIGGFSPDDMAAMWNAGLPIVVGAYTLKSPGVPPFCLNLAPPAVKSNGRQNFIRLKNAGTGFMCIEATALETLTNRCADRRYWVDAATAKWDLFGTGLDPYPADPDKPQYLSEDYFFCALAERHGFETWLYRECGPLTHTGTKVFSRDVRDITPLPGDSS